MSLHPSAPNGRPRQRDPAAVILLVDDSTTVLQSVKLTLELGGWPVVTAQGGDAALQVMDSGLRPALLITDLRMPGGADGLAVIRALRARQPAVPVLALSANIAPALQDEAAQLGVTRWLPKPTGGRLLLQVIDEVMGR